jgi:hypothetical protein
VTLHPAKLLIAYLVESSGETEIEATATEMAITLQKCIVVQHLQTRQILWSMLFAESAAVLLSSRNSTEDVLLSKMGESKIAVFAIFGPAKFCIGVDLQHPRWMLLKTMKLHRLRLRVGRNC